MAAFIEKGDNLIEMPLRVTPILTIFGKIQYKYKLSDFAYGEWIIFENEKPKYYLNLFDNSDYKKDKVYSKSKNFNIESILDKFQKGLSIYQKVWGIPLPYKSFIQTFHLEKLPKGILIN